MTKWFALQNRTAITTYSTHSRLCRLVPRYRIRTAKASIDNWKPTEWKAFANPQWWSCEKLLDMVDGCFSHHMPCRYCLYLFSYLINRENLLRCATPKRFATTIHFLSAGNQRWRWRWKMCSTNVTARCSVVDVFVYKQMLCVFGAAWFTPNRSDHHTAVCYEYVAMPFFIRLSEGGMGSQMNAIFWVRVFMRKVITFALGLFSVYDWQGVDGFGVFNGTDEKEIEVTGKRMENNHCV